MQGTLPGKVKPSPEWEEELGNAETGGSRTGTQG
jgi:hypothetical protein